MFEHASECKILLKHLQRANDSDLVKQGPKTSVSSTQVTQEQQFYVKLTETKAAQGSDSPIGSPSKIIDKDNIILTLERSLIDLTLTANGKADLYFHAYFWYTFSTGLYQQGEQTPDAAAAVESFD